MRVNYFHIEWFSKTDGPGNRTVLFLQGCNLRCPWCHSPHSREMESPILFNPIRCLHCHNCIDICNNGVHFLSDGIHMLQRSNCTKCGRCVEACPTSRIGSDSGALILPTRSMDTLELFTLLWPQLEVVKKSGGLTISGGEALLQQEAVLELLKHCKSRGIHTAIETSLSLPVENYQLVSEYVDCWLIGMRNAYLENKTIQMVGGMIENIHYLSSLGTKVIVRFPAIKGYTTSQAKLSKITELMRLGGFHDIQVLPCNKNMKHYYTLSGIIPEINIEETFLDEAEIHTVVSFFQEQGLNVRLIT